MYFLHYTIVYIKVQIYTLFDHTTRELLHRILGDFLNDFLCDLFIDLLFVDFVGMLDDVVTEWVLDDCVEVISYEHHEYTLHLVDAGDFLHEGFDLNKGRGVTTRTAFWF